MGFSGMEVRRFDQLPKGFRVTTRQTEAVFRYEPRRDAQRCSFLGRMEVPTNQETFQGIKKERIWKVPDFKLTSDCMPSLTEQYVCLPSGIPPKPCWDLAYFIKILRNHCGPGAALFWRSYAQLTHFGDLNLFDATLGIGVKFQSKSKYIVKWKRHSIEQQDSFASTWIFF